MNYIAKILNKILGLVYPTKCIECGKAYEKYLCNKCKVKLGIKLELHIDEYKNKNFGKHIYLFKYDGWIREKIIKYKFKNGAYLHRFFSECFKEINKKNDFLKKYDYIIPIPISKRRKKERGYNQSELLAKKISIQIKDITFANFINKKIDNKAQSTLNQKEREINVKDVYEINKKENYKEMLNKNILLLDDIFTTGSTVNECARVLKKLGKINIDVFTIAKV